MRSSRTQEHRTVLCRDRPATSEIRGHCLADISGQRKAFDSVAFASHNKLARAPVDVVEIQLRAGAGADAGSAGAATRARRLGRRRDALTPARELEQGYEIRRPSMVMLQARSAGSREIRVGGNVVPIAHGELP